MSVSSLQISVIIPVYNREKRLLRALKSVYSQSLIPSEVIVVDDGSDLELAPVVKMHFPQVSLIKQTHAGVSRARNNGVERAKGDWVAFLDSDDEWLPNKLERQMRELNQCSELLCHTNEIWIRNGVRVNQHNKHQKYGGDIFQYCLSLCAVSPSSVVIQKHLFQRLGGFDETLPACEDYDLWLRVTARHKVSYINEPLITKYGGHDDQLSQKHWGMDRFRIYSMEKLYQQGELSTEQLKDLLSELIKKCTIFANGAQKRGQTDSYRTYSEKSLKYQLLLAELKVS